VLLYRCCYWRCCHSAFHDKCWRDARVAGVEGCCYRCCDGCCYGYYLSVSPMDGNFCTSAQMAAVCCGRVSTVRGGCEQSGSQEEEVRKRVEDGEEKEGESGKGIEQERRCVCERESVVSVCVCACVRASGNVCASV